MQGVPGQLRRNRRRADARTQLNAALALFDQLGAAGWAGRARRELAATGIPSSALGTPKAGVLILLTPQELQVVALAAQGLSNRDIGAWAVCHWPLRR
jgi:DNA-binding NarL/FixJ family response regulator